MSKSLHYGWDHKDDSDIIQIIPAPSGFYAVYEVDGENVTMPIVCIALLRDGTVCFMDTDDYGQIDTVMGREIIYPGKSCKRSDRICIQV